MPYEYSLKLREGRNEVADQHELSAEHLICAEKAYLKLVKKYFYDTIDCVENGKIKTIDEISKEIINLVIGTYYLSCQIDLKGEENE